MAGVARQRGRWDGGLLEQLAIEVFGQVDPDHVREELQDPLLEVFVAKLAHVIPLVE